MTSNPALSTAENVLAVADQFIRIADLLHRHISHGAMGTGKAQPLSDLYGILVEEYGLRARAVILRNDATARIVDNTAMDQATLVQVLIQAGEAIARIDELEQLRSLVAGVSTLCVGISPGKGRVVDFLAKELDADVQSLRMA